LTMRRQAGVLDLSVNRVIARAMNSLNALALAFAASIAGSPVSGAGQGPPHPYTDQRHMHLHRRAAAAPRLGPTQTLSHGTPTLQRSTARPLVTNDSDGLSRNPEDCNKGCLDSSP